MIDTSILLYSLILAHLYHPLTGYELGLAVDTSILLYSLILAHLYHPLTGYELGLAVDTSIYVVLLNANGSSLVSSFNYNTYKLLSISDHISEVGYILYIHAIVHI